MQQHVVFIAH